LQERSNLLRPSEQVFPSYFIRDTYAPITHGTYEAARDAVNCALTGAQLLLNEERLVYGLCRPPGHHAEYFAIGGYCYFNNAAAAAEYLSHHGAVAILDIDFHHGNGTQNIFYTRDDVFYVSLHADPNKKYPYVAGFAEETGIEKGRGYNRNYPLPLTTSETMYRKTLVKAIQTIRDFDPSFLIVSGGFDTYIKDPIGGLNLTVPFYEIIGKDINSLHLPTLIIQEGGYFVKDLREIACSFLKGFK